VLHDGEQGPPGVLGAEGERNPCPDCGATRRTIEKSLNDVVVVTDVTVTPKVSAATTPSGWRCSASWLRRAWRSGSASLGRAGVATFLAITIVFAIPKTRHFLMSFAHRLTGR
jgi:hypothetical protein